MSLSVEDPGPAPSKKGDKPSASTRLICAIDFGMARSGYAFAMKSCPEEIYCEQSWRGGMTEHQKTLTNVLIKDADTLECSFGFDARDEYLEMEKKEQEEALFFEKFKMCLYEPGALDPVATSANGKTLPAVTVFAAALKFMKDHALAKINGTQGGNWTSDDILWVLTVPAIWDNKAKQIMRKAAERAGMCRRPKQLRLALEPEGASLACRSDRKKKNYNPLEKGTDYMVVDCGGGTVDITCHRVVDDTKVKELHKPSGGNWGSVCIDLAYQSLLYDIFGKDRVDKFITEQPASWVGVMDKFELSKCRATGKEERRGVELSFAFLNYLENELKKEEPAESIKSRCKKYTADLDNENMKVSYREGVLQLSQGILLDKLFMPTITKIKDHVSNLLEEVKAKHIFVVGGFAESKILQDQLKSLEDEHGVEVTSTLRPGLAICQGSVLFGLAPESITSRRSKYTYGCGTTTSDIQGHPLHRIEKDKKGVPRVYKIFDRFVTVNQEVDTDFVVHSRFYPLYEDQKSVSFKLYRSTDPHPNYTDEASVERVGVISVAIPDTTGGKDRPIDVAMKFGGTEIEVEAVAVLSKERAHITIDFQSNDEGKSDPQPKQALADPQEKKADEE